jgi:sec-independent protein translocase protein TatC
MDRERKGRPSGGDPEDEGGGPVKSFLEHLEDLRWTLIKSIIAVLLSMLVAMVGSKYIVTVLTWPMNHSLFGKAIFAKEPDKERVTIHLGTNFVGLLPSSLLGYTTNLTNFPRSFSIAPVPVGTNYMLSFVPDDKAFEISTSPSLGSLGPLSPVMVALKIALYGGLILAAPFVIFFIGQFVLPALHVHEKRLLYQAAGFGIGLFIMGVLFAYFVITGVAIAASVDLATWLGFSTDLWRIEEYISFISTFMLGMGICFEIPVVILILVKIGLLDHRKLSAFRTYAIVVNLIIGAVVTPSTDPFSMLLFAAPLQLLYELSVVIAWFWARRDRKRAEAEAAVLDV